ncbi:MAG: hypothetical protein KDA84_05895 [Planctomycetaceae bacterium]|nr:hypothetical protein [Planctomycetaceae bacterium]
MIDRDAEFVDEVIRQSRKLDSQGDEELRRSIPPFDAKIRALMHRTDD